MGCRGKEPLGRVMEQVTGVGARACWAPGSQRGAAPLGSSRVGGWAARCISASSRLAPAAPLKGWDTMSPVCLARGARRAHPREHAEGAALCTTTVKSVGQADTSSRVTKSLHREKWRVFGSPEQVPNSAYEIREGFPEEVVFDLASKDR